MKFAILGIIIGVVIGFIVPVTYSSSYSLYMAMAILVCLDTVIGGVRANLKKDFDTRLFLSGLIINFTAIALLTYIGEVLGVPVYYAGLVFFGSRILRNTSLIGKILIRKA